MSAERPAISVVIPTIGRVRSLERCLDALAGAAFDRSRYEVVVANDRGSEDVEALAGSFGGRLHVTTIRPHRSGPSAARNAGAWASRGEHVAFTDDDCEPEAGWLAALERSLQANAGAAVGGTVRNGAVENLGAVATQAVVDALHAVFNRERGSPRFFASSNVAFPAEPFRALGGFDPDARYAEDRELCDRWARAGHPLVSAPDAVVVHMRTLGLREFMGQHYGYGRGAFAFSRAQPAAQRRADRSGVARELARESARRHDGHSRLALAGYLVLSQLATAAGFAREALASPLRR